MATLAATTGISLAQPGWLVLLLTVVPVLWMGRRHLVALAPVRRWCAMVLRCLGILILVLLLARLQVTRTSEDVAVVAIVDRSQSIAPDLLREGLNYLAAALPPRLQRERLAVVDVAETATIARLASTDPNVPLRNTTLQGDQTHLAQGIQLALAIAPPDCAIRLCLLSEGNETVGDLREAARIAAANRIPIDVLPLRYRHVREVVFRHLAAPAQARQGESVALRFVLESTQAMRGQLQLYLNGQTVDLDPESDRLSVSVALKAGVNVKTVSIPLPGSGAHQFEAVFVPDTRESDQVAANNRAHALTVVAGPGHILLATGHEQAATDLTQGLADTGLSLRALSAVELPHSLNRLIDVDAVVLVDVDASQLTYQQMEMLNRYVTELGGGLVMVGGPHSFGAGGWIGSPVAEILPVDLDPPQKKQLPKGALVLVMHACEMPQGNYWGKQVAVAAIKTLSQRDLVGILAYNWKGGDNWVYPLAEVGNKAGLIQAIEQMQMGDMPDLGSHLQQSYDALMAVEAGQRHVIVISDGDPVGPSRQLLDQMKEAKITCSGVGVFPHSQNDINSLIRIAQLTDGRFYQAMDPSSLPQIFVKEAQIVKRSLILEETFTPKVTYGLSETIQGLDGFPNLDGYVITAPKGGLSNVVLASAADDPILATTQAGLGRCVAFTSAADSRWASSWLQWAGHRRFWEQVIRWAAKPATARDCELVVDVRGRQVDVHVETVDAQGQFVPLVGLETQVIGPDMAVESVSLRQTGPGQYQGGFAAQGAGSYLVNMRYRRADGQGQIRQVQASVAVPYAPEFSDLTDNVALLAEVSALTGGRVLSAEPEQAGLFLRDGLHYPQTQWPLTLPLLLLWLLVFLLDVAVRRVRLDPGALWRRWQSWQKGRAESSRSDAHLTRLKETRAQVRQGRTGPGQRAAAQRFQAEGTPGETKPAPSVAPAPETTRAADSPGEEKAASTEAEENETHIDQLLRAKRQARGGHADPDT